ncbi:hypothetical protein KUCAC02_034069 [Chaenocephalus aceratus]|nr:hypothetical protein KUCAC02_034069 [Chaenocephalus aceratus]
MATPAASRVLFSEAVRQVLLSWPVLQIAVDNGFGGVYGTQKADWMVDVVQQFFHDNADLQRGEVEDFLCDIMNQEFNTVMFSQWQQGALQTLRNTIDALSQKKISRKADPPEEEDGWTVVKKK